MLCSPVTILKLTNPSTFLSDEEIGIRPTSLRLGELPEFFFRAHYASCGTIRSYMLRDCWPSVHLELVKGAVFQSLGSFFPAKDLSLRSVLRHFVWQQKHPFTTFISFFDSYGKHSSTFDGV